MSSLILHYVHDPLCGWCYGAAPLIAAARRQVSVRSHGGGMMAGEARQAVTPQLRDYVIAHDRRIAALTGQPFGSAYFDGLLRDPTAVFDSSPPITAVIAADRLGDRGLDLLAAIQSAHYVDGRQIADPAVLATLAQAVGIDNAAFAAAYAACQGDPTRAHIRATRELMARCGLRGFPGFVLERDGCFERLDHGPLIGKPEAFANALATALDAPAGHAAVSASASFAGNAGSP